MTSWWARLVCPLRNSFSIREDYQLQISAVTIDDVADFTVNKKGCNAAVQPQQACVIYVTFHPTVAGPITGTLTFTDNALDSPETVTVMGNGLTAYPVPSTTGVSPNAILQGSPAQAITVFGTGFFQTSRISVRGTQLATTYLGETALSAKVPVGMLKNLGELLVQVVTPAPGGGIFEQHADFGVSDPADQCGTAWSTNPTLSSSMLRLARTQR